MIGAGGRGLVMIPTYNERENVEPICAGILGLGLGLDVVFVDDSSPDGTGAVLDDLTGRHPGVTALHRPGKQGIGSAHRFGIDWAYRHGYTRLITMDADFSHRVEDLPAFLAAVERADVVVGSRYLTSESLREWNVARRSLTRFAHLLTASLLGLGCDATGAYRLYRLDRIPADVFARVRASGYAFFFESVYRLHRGGFTIHEIPISLPARALGHSKMGLREIVVSLAALLRLAAGRLREGRRRRSTVVTRVAP